MNDIQDKNGIINCKYIGTISGTAGTNWVGAVKLGNKIYVGQGASVYHEYHPYDPKTFAVAWHKIHKISIEQFKELTRQKDLYDK